MNVAFYYNGVELPPYFDTFTAAVRQQMPTARIIHLTDETTPGCETADEVRRLSCPWPTQPVNPNTITAIGHYYLSICDIPDMLFAEPDMLFAAPLDDLMAGECDVTIARRPAYDNISASYRRLYPYNSFIIAKTPQFYKDVWNEILRFRRVRGSINMEAVGRVVNSGKYTVRFLDGETYNARPRRYSPAIKVYHFRIGSRKETAMPAFYKAHIATGTIASEVRSNPVVSTYATNPAVVRFGKDTR